MLWQPDSYTSYRVIFKAIAVIFKELLENINSEEVKEEKITAYFVNKVKHCSFIFWYLRINVFFTH